MRRTRRIRAHQSVKSIHRLAVCMKNETVVPRRTRVRWAAVLLAPLLAAALQSIGGGPSTRRANRTVNHCRGDRATDSEAVLYGLLIDLLLAVDCCTKTDSVSKAGPERSNRLLYRVPVLRLAQESSHSSVRYPRPIEPPAAGDLAKTWSSSDLEHLRDSENPRY